MRGPVCHVILVLMAIALPAAAAARQGSPDGGRIRVIHEPPKTAAYREIYDAMRARHVLERVGAVVGLGRLPTCLTYRLKECAGEFNSWYAPEPPGAAGGETAPAARPSAPQGVGRAVRVLAREAVGWDGTVLRRRERRETGAQRARKARIGRGWEGAVLGVDPLGEGGGGSGNEEGGGKDTQGHDELLIERSGGNHPVSTGGEKDRGCSRS